MENWQAEPHNPTKPNVVVCRGRQISGNWQSPRIPLGHAACPTGLIPVPLSVVSSFIFYWAIGPICVEVSVLPMATLPLGYSEKIATVTGQIGLLMFSLKSFRCPWRLSIVKTRRNVKLFSFSVISSNTVWTANLLLTAITVEDLLSPHSLQSCVVYNLNMI